MPWPAPMGAWPLPPGEAALLLGTCVHIYSSIRLSWTTFSPSNKDHLSRLSQTSEPTRKQKGVGSTLEVGACQWLGPGQKARPWAGERTPGGGGKTGWTSPAFLGWLQQPHWIWVREISLKEDPRAFPTQRKDTGGVASGWSRGHTQCWESQGVPREMGGSRYSKPHWNKRQADSGLGRGAGRLSATAGPLLVLQGSSQHPKAVYGSCHPQRKASPELGRPIRVHPILPPAHTGRVTAPTVGYG